jgi:hypothetical protein
LRDAAYMKLFPHDQAEVRITALIILGRESG